MPKEKRIKFRIELGIGGLILTITVTVCLMVWMFILGLWLGQNLAVGRAKKAPSPVAEKTLSAQAKRGLKEELPRLEGPPIKRDFRESPLSENTFEAPSAPLPQTSPKKEATKPLVETQFKESSKEKVSPAKSSPQRPPKVASKKQVRKTFYSLQVASLRSAREAQRYARRLRARGYEAFVRKVNLKEKGIWYRVHVGRFETMAEASSFAKKLAQKERIKSFVVPIKE
ncbi:SPOR domain-containing protein [Thermosulfuriphilus sp.]